MRLSNFLWDAVLVTYCCVTNHPTTSQLQTQAFSISQFLWVRHP